MSVSVIFNPAEGFADYNIKIDERGGWWSYEIVKVGDEEYSLRSTTRYPGAYLALAAAILALQVEEA